MKDLKPLGLGAAVGLVMGGLTVAGLLKPSWIEFTLWSFFYTGAAVWIVGRRGGSRWLDAGEFAIGAAVAVVAVQAALLPTYLSNNPEYAGRVDGVLDFVRVGGSFAVIVSLVEMYLLTWLVSVLPFVPSGGEEAAEDSAESDLPQAPGERED